MSQDKFAAFYDLLLAYQRVERVVYVPGTSRWENDVEHSYMLAMHAWYLIQEDQLPLDTALALQYALVHDLVEVHAGDTYLYDAAARATKRQREEQAAARLKQEYPEFPDLHKTIAAYEAQADGESRFIRALDKLQPMLSILADGGRLWRERGITLDMLVSSKQPVVDRSPEVKPYFDDLVAYLRTRPELFTEPVV